MIIKQLKYRKSDNFVLSVETMDLSSGVEHTESKLFVLLLQLKQLTPILTYLPSSIECTEQHL